MVYEPLYHALERVCSKLKQAENRLYLQKKSGRILDIFSKTIINKHASLAISAASYIQRALVE